MSAAGSRPLAVVTGASSGIGRELAREAANRGYDLVIAADRDGLDSTATELRTRGIVVDSVEADLSARPGVDALCNAIAGRPVAALLANAIAGRPVAALLANAGHGLGHAFLDQDFDAARHVIDTNITGTLYLIHRAGQGMRAQGEGRILITGSIAGFQPGAFQAVYNASKAFIDSFSYALRNELKDSGVTVTCLMPGPTDTEFFDRAGLLDTKVGTDKKADPAAVAKAGFEAMLDGESDVIAGWKNKLQATLANVTPAETLAEQHRKMAEPGTAVR